MKTLTLAVLFATALSTPVLAQSVPPSSHSDEIVVAGARSAENRDEQRFREAIAYANPMPRGAPTDSDYALVAWCDALVSGHVALGESLNTNDELDLELIRLGRLEATDFRTALAAGRSRQTPAVLAQAEAAAARGRAEWTPYMDRPQQARDEAFGLFLGLPGRCEHAARRVRNNITTPPATPQDVGLEVPAPLSTSEVATPPQGGPSPAGQ